MFVKRKKRKIEKLNEQQRNGTSLITITKPNSVIADSSALFGLIFNFP